MAEPTERSAVEDMFEVRLRFMGNEILGFALLSSSPKKNWLFFGIMTMFGVAALVSAIAPIVTAAME